MSVFACFNVYGGDAESQETGIHIEYAVKIDKAEQDHFHVKAKIYPLPLKFLRLKMTQNYGNVDTLEKLLSEISFQDSSQRVPKIKKINEFLWEVECPDQTQISVEYTVNTKHPYSSLNMSRLPFRDDAHLYFPAASIFIHPEEDYLEENKIRIRTIRIGFDPPAGWMATTSWGSNQSTYALQPPSLETLNRGLIGVGAYRLYSFRVKELPVEVALLGAAPLADEEIKWTIKCALQAGHSLFGFFPVPRFFALFNFIFDQPGQGGGNALGWSIKLDFSRRSDQPRWQKSKANIYHEIFHFWNGTEDAPVSRAQNDRSLIWFTEGVTTFYQYKNMLCSELITEEKYRDFLAEEFSAVYQSARNEDRLDRISEDYYSDQTAMALTYSKGCCLAFAADLLLQHVTSGKKSFDDLMKTMLKKYDFRLNRHCYTHEELDGVFLEILSEKYFPSYRKLYRKDFVREFESILDSAGLQIEKSKGKKLYFGIIGFGPPSGPLSIQQIDRESPAYKAGLKEGDVLIGINRCPVKNVSDINKCLEGVDEREVVGLLIQRATQTINIQASWASFETIFKIKEKGKIF